LFKLVLGDVALGLNNEQFARRFEGLPDIGEEIGQTNLAMSAIPL
jgi:hypothetical protein